MVVTDLVCADLVCAERGGLTDHGFNGLRQPAASRSRHGTTLESSALFNAAASHS